MFAGPEPLGEEEKAKLLSERITEKIRPIIKDKKSAQESAMILSCLKNHFIFYNLSQA